MPAYPGLEHEADASHPPLALAPLWDGIDAIFGRGAGAKPSAHAILREQHDSGGGSTVERITVRLGQGYDALLRRQTGPTNA